MMINGKCYLFRLRDDVIPTRQYSAGNVIGPYVLVDFLGKGAFGEVWLANRKSDIVETRLAVKLALSGMPDISAIRQEAELWVRASNHPNILPLFEAASFDQQVVIASEYAPDGTLQDRLNNQGPPPIDAVIQLTIGMLCGLSHLHQQGIVHRDLKPTNILMKRDVPCLADFGLARVIGVDNSNQIAGTPAYMSPEAFAGNRSPLSDIWSIGVILHRLLSGELPFDCEHGREVLIRNIMTSEPARLPAKIPARLRDIVTVALRKNEAQRYQSAEAMLAALRSLGEIESARLSGNDIIGWGTFIDVEGACAINVHPRSLTIFIPGGDYDLGAERGLMNAPRILSGVDGDFIVQVHVSGSQTPLRPAGQERRAFQGAGILLWQDEGTFARLERASVMTAANELKHYINFEIRHLGEVLRWGRSADLQLSAGEDVVLRIERIDDEITAAVRQENCDWHILETTTISLSNQLSVGIAAVNTSQQPMAAEFRRFLMLRNLQENALHDTERLPDTAPI